MPFFFSFTLSLKPTISTKKGKKKMQNKKSRRTFIELFYSIKYALSNNIIDSWKTLNQKTEQKSTNLYFVYLLNVFAFEFVFFLFYLFFFCAVFNYNSATANTTNIQTVVADSDTKFRQHLEYCC